MICIIFLYGVEGVSCLDEMWYVVYVFYIFFFFQNVSILELVLQRILYLFFWIEFMYRIEEYVFLMRIMGLIDIDDCSGVVSSLYGRLIRVVMSKICIIEWGLKVFKNFVSDLLQVKEQCCFLLNGRLIKCVRMSKELLEIDFYYQLKQE